MAAELSRDTNYHPPHQSLNLSIPGSRIDMGPVDHKNFETAVEIAGTLGLTKHSREINRGKNRILKISGATLNLTGYARQVVEHRRLGFAVEFARNTDGTGEPIPRAIFVREAMAFNEESFVAGVNDLLNYDDNTRLPRFSRGYWIYGISMAIGAGAGLLALGGFEYFTSSSFDIYTRTTFAGAGATAGYFGGEHKYKNDNWVLKDMVPDLDQYYGNNQAQERLVRIASHLETVKTLNQIEASLRFQDVDVSGERIASIWRSDIDLGFLIKRYNNWVYGEGADDRERMKGEIFNQMVDRIREVARRT